MRALPQGGSDSGELSVSDPARVRRVRRCLLPVVHFLDACAHARLAALIMHDDSVAGDSPATCAIMRTALI